MLKQFLEAGKVVGMHGVRGEMRFDVWCDGADFLKKIKIFSMSLIAFHLISLGTRLPTMQVTS